MSPIKFVFVSLSILFSTVCMAQEGIVRVMNNKLYAMYHKAKYDTNYVSRPEQKFNAQVFGENGQSEISWETDGYKADASSNKSHFKFEGQSTEIDKIDMGFIATARCAAIYNFSRYYLSIMER